MPQDFQHFNSQPPIDSESATERAANGQCMGSYSPKETARAVEISTRTVFKYADILIPLWGEERVRSDGLYTQFAIDEMKRIKELKPGRYEKTVRRQLDQPENIPPPCAPQTSGALTVRRNSTIALETDFDALYEEMSATYLGLDEAESQTTQRLEELQAEILDHHEALSVSKEQENAIAHRAAIMRGIEKAMGEFGAEQKAYITTLNKLRREGKLNPSIEEFKA